VTGEAKRVPPELAGERLDRVLSHLAGLSRSAGRALIESGVVRVNGEVATAPAARLNEGDELAYRVGSEPELVRPEPVDFGVVWEDDWLAVVDKPAGVVTHPGAGNLSGTLVAGLLDRWPNMAGVGSPGRWGIVHRLDKGTSGLLVVAKTGEAYEGLSELIRHRRVQRRYLALVQEPMPIETGTVDAPIDRDPTRPVRRRVSPYGRPARTHYEQVAAWFAHSLLEIQPETGRTHQIRVHLSAIGHPVVGDRTYGASPADPADPGRPWLHAWQLAFDHPVTGQAIACEAPLPGDLVGSLLTLGEPAAGSLPVDMARRDRRAILLETTTRVQRSFEDILYEEDPWGVAGGPRDEYNQIASRLISVLARASAGDEERRTRETIPEAGDALVSRILDEWARHPLLHSINRQP
jgi:23S rRNA pseudouridine1911/1915/1917 synthase